MELILIAKQFACQDSSEIHVCFTLNCFNWLERAKWGFSVVKSSRSMLKQASQRSAAASECEVWSPVHNVAPVVCWNINVCSDVRGVIGSLGAVTPPSCVTECFIRLYSYLEDKGEEELTVERRAVSPCSARLTNISTSWQDDGKSEKMPSPPHERRRGVCLRRPLRSLSGWGGQLMYVSLCWSQKASGFDTFH